jgi:hypothetical protein
VTDGEAPARFGCTFCRRPLPDGRPHRGLPPLDWAVAQLAAVARTHPPSATGRLSLRLVGERVVNRVDELAARVAELRLLPAEILPVEFLIDARSDTLVRVRERLGVAAGRLGAAGHTVEVCLIGVESFSARELRRFNKGFGPEVNLAAVRVLRELERDHPGVFGFRKYGGLSTVLYTPWTTLEDVACNLAILRHFDLRRLCGKVLTSRVRLYEELPLAARARRDGLLVASYDDPALDTARRNFYESELPWRFADPRVDRFNRLATRLQLDGALAGEPLYEEVQRWAAAAAGAGDAAARDEIDLAERLCRAIERHPDETDLRGLLARAAEEPSRRRSRLAGPEGVTAAARAGEQGRGNGERAHAHEHAHEHEHAHGHGPRPTDTPRTTTDTDTATPAPPDPLLAGSQDWRGFLAGIKPVCRLEPLSAAELPRVTAAVRAAAPGAALQARRRDWNDVESWELFVGRDPAEVAELIAILSARDRGLGGDEGRAHVQRTGELLGYPACCVAAFAATPEVGWLHNEWLHVRNRVAAPGPVPTSIRPLNGPLSYVTCGATCAASQAKAEVLRAAGDPSVDPPRARWPMLFLLDRPSHFAVLEPLALPGPAPADPSAAERLRYRLAESYGADERFAALARGDTLVIEPGQVRVVATGADGVEAVLAHFTLDAYVWWHERAFHPEFWRLAVQQKLDPLSGRDAPPEEADRGVDENVPEVPEEQQVVAQAAHVPRLDAVLGWVKRLLVQAGVPCRSLLPTAAGDLDLVLDVGGRALGLRWLNRDAPAGVVAVLGAPLVPLPGTNASAAQKLAPRLQEVLAPAWARGLADKLDRGNREHLRPDPAQGVRFLLGKRIAATRPLWGAWVLESFDEAAGTDGRPRATLVARAGGVRVVVAFGAPVDGPEPPFWTGGLGVLRVVEDGRTEAQRAKVAHQVERCLGFHFARAVPAAARWTDVDA